jgi:esterase/lipase superfamily enzyme
MKMSNQLQMRVFLLIGCTLLLAACSGPRVMMPTPNVHIDDDTSIYDDIHPEFKSTEVPLFYLTDRAPERDENGNLKYGYQRSRSRSEQLLWTWVKI